MFYSRFFRLIIFISLASFWSSQADADERAIAITIDDLPAVATGPHLHQKRSMNLSLLAALARHEAPAIGFVNEGRLYADGQLDPDLVDILRLWTAAGMELGNHSFAHRDFHQTPLPQFQQDVINGETVTREVLAERGQTPRYFRHPYLRTGRDLEKRAQFETFLAERDYVVAPVTIDNSEWIFASAYANAVETSDTELAQQIGDDYVVYMAKIVLYYEDQTEIFYQRRIPHILLLHANQLNADYLTSLLDGLVNRGYRFVSLDEALADPVYNSVDTYDGPAGITWLHRWAISRGESPAKFAGEPRVPPYVLKLVGLEGSGY